jgi:hypothetical protein
MHVRFSRATRSSALPAFVVIAPQYGLANVAQSADKADILIGIPQSAPDDNVKSKRWRYGLASALGHVWTAPWQELSDVSAALVGCGHVSGLLMRPM